MIHEGSKYAYLVKGVRKLEPGEAMLATQYSEFTCTPESFRNTVYSAARTAGSHWRATATIIGTSVVYAFYRTDDYMRPNLPAYPIVRKMRGE